MKKILPFLLAIALLISLYVIKTQKDDKTEMLKSFQSLEVSLNNSNENLKKSSNYKLGFMSIENESRPEIVTPYLKRGEEVRKVSEEFVDYIESLKSEIEKKEEDNESIDISFFNTDNKAKRLKLKLDSTRNNFLYLIKSTSNVKFNPITINDIVNKNYLFTNYDTEKYSSWANMYLKNLTIIEGLTFLTKLQNECRNFELDIISVLARSIESSHCGFDILEAKVIPNALMIKVGTEYRAEVLLIASNSQSDNPVIVNGDTLPMKEGKGIYSTVPTTPGVHYFEGVIQVKGPAGIKEYPFKEKYEAF